jgi:hypothetical protein
LRPHLTSLQKQFAAFETGSIGAFIGFHTTLDMPNEHFEDEEKNVYTEYSPLGVCGGEYMDDKSQTLELTMSQLSAPGTSP